MAAMVALALLLALAGAPQAAAQAPSPLRGVVLDQTGAVLPAAQVELRDQAGAIVRQVVTDSRGEFQIDAPPPGTYTLHIQFEGFRPSSTTIRIAARRPLARQSFVLDLASVNQEVTVGTGTDVVTAAANANRDAVVISDKELKDLPVFDRNIVGTPQS